MQTHHPDAGSGAVVHLYATELAYRGTTYESQLSEAVNHITDTFARNGGKVTHQSIFIRDPARIGEVHRALLALYGNTDIPATSYIAQPPCDEGKLLSVEASGIAGATVEYRGAQSTVVRHDGITWVQTANVGNGERQEPSAYDQTGHALTDAESALASAGARVEQIVRTWFYVGNITSADAHATSAQRYQELNRSRTDFFQGIDFLTDYTPASISRAVYPASTAIGMAGQDIRLSTLALLTKRDDVRTVPLENPRQVAAFDYAKHYSPQSPKFSRAMAVAYGDKASIYISGTASITASETQHIGNAALQTEETLDNITALISAENLTRHGLPGFSAGLGNLGIVRAYVKHAADYPAVRAVCEKRLGEIPVIYTIGDVCRDDLLVELEGIAHATATA
ncbi:MAG: hypothetical protein REI94_16435 [Moraxellaceae bacterium]|nr:hypothetical protein [Moraxellaceae bacterium]